MRTIVVGEQTFRWRFEEQLVVVPANRSSPQLVVTWGWEDWLEPGSQPSSPLVVTPRFVAAAIQFALQNGWKADAAGPAFQLAYDRDAFRVVLQEQSRRHNRGGYTVPATELIDYPPSAIDDFHLYGVEWIDNLHFILPPERFLVEPAEYLEIARARWLAAGWEGDGEIGLLWLPPFVFPSSPGLGRPEGKRGHTGILLWHVKQEEDGVSWLLSPITLPFAEFAGRLTDP